MMLNQPSTDCRVRPVLGGAHWCAFLVLCLLAPAVLFAGDRGFQGKAPIPLAVLAAVTVLGAGLIGSRFLKAAP